MSNLEKLINELCPNGVEYKKLGEVFDLKNGYTPSKAKNEYWENGTIPWFRMEDLRLNGNILSNAIQNVNSVGIKGKLFPKNSIIMSTTATIGEHALILNDYMCNQRFTNFTIKEEFIKEFDIKFIFYYFFILDNQAKKSVNTSSFPSVQMNELKKIIIPLPPLSVQEEIVRILDTFAELTTELTTELTLREKQYEYYRDKLLIFGDEVEWKTLGEVAINLNSKRKPVTSGLREIGSIPYYGASGIVDYVKEYIFDDDLLLVSEDGANLISRNTPIAFSVSGKIWVNNHAHVLKFNSYTERKYIEYYLNNIDLIPYISGSAQPKLNKKNLDSILIPVPPIEEQERIVAILDKFDTLTNSINEGFPYEIELRKKQYEYYRDKLLTFKKLKIAE